MEPVTLLSVSVPYLLKAIAWAFQRAPDAATAAQSIAAAAESGAGLIELVKQAKDAFKERPKQGVLLRRCLLITGLAVRAAREVAPPATKAEKAALEAEIKLAWDVCAATVPDPEAALGNALNDWLAPPLSTPWGRALWDVLARRPTGEHAPVLASSLERRAFERRFMAAWSLNTSTGEGAEIERAVLGLGELDAAQLREQLVADLASWGGRHVFGNLRAGADLQGMPWMSLEAVYVEPEVTWVERHERQRGPALRTLWDTVQKHPLTLVIAPVGFGKTLTARMFVRERALDWLEEKNALGERWLPVYVRCADHLQADEVDLEALVAKAWASQWEGLSGETLRSRDPRLSLPREETRLVIVLDGLNEVHLRQDQVERLLHMLHTAERCPTLRVVVFSRPGAVPAKDKLPKSAATLEVQTFEEAQVNQWLDRWRALHQAGPRSIEEVQGALKHWLSNPVLLFLLAWTWPSHNGRLPSGVALYEQFLRRVAQSKTEHDRVRHAVIAEASKDALDRLIQLNHLSPGATPEDGMLWLLGRVALEMHRREQTPSAGPLNRQGVENLVEKLLGLRADTKALELLSLGCVLPMRADLRGDQPALIFGHRSFQEFLVARAWREQLRRIVSPPQGSTRKKEERVLEGLLIQGQGDYTIHFLTELVEADEPAERARLKGWAKSMVEDLRVGRPFEDDDERPATYTDTRASLALAAFAIGGAIAGERWFTVNGAVPLRRVLAWARLTRSVVSVIAPKLSGNEDEDGWSLTRADLSDADLSFADLSNADLSGANLSRAYLSDARLSDANLSNASLCSADLFDANLHRANLSGADLSGASLYIAYFPHANLHRANLSGADLSDAMLHHANLSDANLHRANLSDADLFGANLHRANLSCTSLYDVNLYNAQDLSTANLHNARFTINHPYYSDTRWPLEFPAEAAIAAGAHPNLPGQDAWPDPHPDPDE